MDELRDPLHRPGEGELWSVCEERGCTTRVRLEYRCREHREPGISSAKFCEAEECWDVLHHKNPRRFCGAHEHMASTQHEIWWDTAEALA